MKKKLVKQNFGKGGRARMVYSLSGHQVIRAIMLEDSPYLLCSLSGHTGRGELRALGRRGALVSAGCDRGPLFVASRSPQHARMLPATLSEASN